jgi:hypothetical protein
MLKTKLKVSKETLAALTGGAGDAMAEGGSYSGTCGQTRCTYSSCESVGYTNMCCTNCSCATE